MPAFATTLQRELPHGTPLETFDVTADDLLEAAEAHADSESAAWLLELLFKKAEAEMSLAAVQQLRRGLNLLSPGLPGVLPQAAAAVAAAGGRSQQQLEQIPTAAPGKDAVLPNTTINVAIQEQLSALPAVLLLSQGCNAEDDHTMFTCEASRANSVSNSESILRGAPPDAHVAATCELSCVAVRQRLHTPQRFVPLGPAAVSTVCLHYALMDTFCCCFACPPADGNLMTLREGCPSLFDQIVIVDLVAGSSDQTPIKTLAVHHKVGFCPSGAQTVRQSC